VSTLLQDGVAIRPADAADRDRLAALPSAIPFIEYPAIIAVAHGQVAAFLQFRRVADGEIEILQLFTAPGFRRRGIARALLRELLDRHAGVSVFLEVRESNAPARQLYESAGFSTTGIRKSYYSNPYEDAIVLSLILC
jgi:ribosomal-protein-alanine N-acetyltransferase